MIDVELSGGFHDGKPWRVVNFSDDVLGDDVPALTMDVYQHHGRMRDGIPRVRARPAFSRLTARLGVRCRVAADEYAT
ncbi:hypothetical protein [Gordonia sp. (in: high G+C Gram-positive bacteria)]|uniref:hypothetical protein n=1 Tax=Gordonia sp. (in: high G+C Gram-positive bacteria) TaxID=84139 RepID=UPI003F953A40